MKIEIYSDVACPWCYIGKARFERALGAFRGGEAVEVTYRPYQLDPQAPAEAEPMLDYLERRFGGRTRAMSEHVSQVARGEGLEMDYERGLAVNTLLAHRLLHLAEREYDADVQRTVAEGLFAAHFSGGQDVGDVETLAEIAGEAGMDPARVRTYLASDEGRGEVEREIAAAQRMGITAVPTFVFDGRYAVQGAQPTSAFLQLLEEVAEETTGVSAEPGGACDDGTCTA